MKQELSILIPVYNDDATYLVESLVKQAQSISGLRYEIVVFDDGSTKKEIVLANRKLMSLPFCRYVSVQHHICRAAMRNDLFSQGKYEWHLMIDARLKLVYDDFLMRYLHCKIREGEVICGGVCVDGGDQTHILYRQNLRFRYEKTEEVKHSCRMRASNPYQSFRTTNFFYHKSVLLQVPYDERVLNYGYEDVLLGKALMEHCVKVNHIDNPVAYTQFEDNGVYLEKIEEALHTLNDFAAELKDFSPLLQLQNRLKRLHLLSCFIFLHRVFKHFEYKNLCSHHPYLWIFKLYKLGYYINIKKDIRI